MKEALSLKKGTDFKTFLERKRTERNLTQDEMAKLVGVSRSYISLLETGAQQAPSPTILKQFAKALRVPVDEIYQISGLLPPDKRTHALSMTALLTRLKEIAPIESPILDLKERKVLGTTFVPKAETEVADVVVYSLVGVYLHETYDVQLVEQIPMFKEGDLAFCYPAHTAEPNDYVIAQWGEGYCIGKADAFGNCQIVGVVYRLSRRFK